MSAPRASRGDASRSDSQSSVAALADARHSNTPHPQSLSRSTARRTAAGPLLALAALLAAPMLGVGGLAHAQTEIWSATVTPGAISSLVGWWDRDPDIGAITDKDFTYDGVTYSLTLIRVASGGGLQINVDQTFTATAIANLVLDVDGSQFPISDSTASGIASRNWNSAGLSWTVGTDVALKMLEQTSTTDATLSNLSLSDGTLTPAFASGTTSYTASVGNAVSQVTVTPTKSDTDASVEYLDGSDATITDADGMATGQQVALVVGANTIKVKVTAEDAMTTQTYTVTVNRATAEDAGEWSATLTTGVVTNLIGCDEELAAFPTIAACSDALTSDQFIHAGTTYSIIGIRYDIDVYRLELKIVPALTGTAKHYLTLVVDGTPLAFGDAVKEDGAVYSTRVWNNLTFSWFPGQSVSLRLDPKPPLPEGDLGATNVFAKRYSAGNVKITWNDITIDGTPLPDQPDGYAVTVSGGRRNTTWALSHLETLFGDPLGRGNRYTVQHPTSTSDTNNQSDDDVAFTYTLKVIGDGWLASGKTFLRIDCPPIGSANAVNCGLSTAPSVLRVRDGSGYEGRSPMAFGVEVDPPSSGTVTVDYATADRTSGTRRARAGQDYDATSGTLTFAPGETKKIVAVGIIDDAVSDNGETFYLNFSNATGATLPDTQATGLIRNTEPLTASFEGVPEAHDGQSAFSFRVAFSEDIGISYQTLRDESFTTTGGAVTGARRVDGRNDLWEITVEPSGAENVTITLPRGRDCGTTGAVCTREDEHTPRALTNSPSATVKGPSASGGVRHPPR